MDAADASPGGASQTSEVQSDAWAREPASPGGPGPRVSVGPWSHRAQPVLSSPDSSPKGVLPMHRPAPSQLDGFGVEPSAQRPVPTLGSGLDAMPVAFSTESSQSAASRGALGGRDGVQPPSFSALRENPGWSGPAGQQARIERPSELCSPVPRLLGSPGLLAAARPPPGTACPNRAPPWPACLRAARLDGRLHNQEPLGIDTSDMLLPHFGSRGALLEGALEDSSPPNFGSLQNSVFPKQRGEHLRGLEAPEGVGEDYAFYQMRGESSRSRREQYKSSETFRFER